MTRRVDRNVFRRPAMWYRGVAYACFGFAAWVLWANIRLTIIGLLQEGWGMEFIQPIAWGIAAVEAAVSIFLTQPENWDALWGGIEDLARGDEKQRVPGIARIVMASVFLVIVLGLCAGAYSFDGLSTHQGLYPLQPITLKTALFTSAFVLGTELLSYLGWQALRMGKVAELDQLQESIEVEPKLVGLRTRRNKAVSQARKGSGGEDSQRPQRRQTWG